MSQECSQQSRIDHFFKVVSHTNTGCGIKQADGTCSQKIRRKSFKPTAYKTKYPLVESEVEIISMKSPVKREMTSIKRTSSNELENSPKKHKALNTSLSSNKDNDQTPVKIQRPSENYSSEENLNIETPKKIENHHSSLKVRRPSEINLIVENLNNEEKGKSKIETNELKNTMNNETPLKVKNNISEENLSDKVVSNQIPLTVRTPSQINSLERNINNKTPIKTTPNQSSSSEKKSTFSPKITPQRHKITTSPRSQKFSPRKLFFSDRINIETVEQAVENLNLVRQGSIVSNEFDLETIYKDQKFNMLYSDTVIPNSQKFEMKDIKFPREKHADHLMMVIMDTFSNTMNCGYFTKDELNVIFSLCTLSPESQMLFVRLLKRNIKWHRTNNIKYLEISDNLEPFFRELVENGFCTSDLESTDVSVLLNMLQADEIRNMCKKLKIDHGGNKAIQISRLLKYGNSSKSFFLGAKSPKAVLRSMALLILHPCICLPKNIFNLFDRVFTLLHPVQDPAESISDFFLTLTNVHKGEILYPPILKKELFPIFKNRSHLISFVESRNALKEILALIEKKEWDAVRDLGRLALEQLSKVQLSQEESSLPWHVKKFAPAFNWAKVLSISVDAFKKTPETIDEAVNILKTLIDNKHFSQSSRGKWYSELALIEMHHKKDLEASAALTLEALSQDALTEVDVSGLLERLRKLMRRKNGISNETKSLIKKTQEDIENKGLAPQPTASKTIMATMANRIEAGGKSTWSLNLNGIHKYYGSVEMLALQHYTSEEEYNEGLHCEGSLPVTMFTVFFWEELYNSFIPGAFVSPYQEVPLDLFTADFFDNRKKSIEEKLKNVRNLDLESFADWMEERYSNYNQYKSIITNTLFRNNQHFKDVVTCLGINGVTGICERLVSNFRLWRSGFPDLIVWNIVIPKCKIVEVKGPGDFLSEKQKLWLQYLERLGIEVEVCHVEASGRGSK